MGRCEIEYHLLYVQTDVGFEVGIVNRLLVSKNTSAFYSADYFQFSFMEQHEHLKSFVFWDIMLCSPVKVSCHFRGT
jgi:hypothetical protein